jgi:N-acetylmuramoyl-L-alanine amidase
MRATVCYLMLGLQLMGTAVAQTCERGDFVVAVDPGHTRASPGAISARGVPEVTFNEKLARRIIGNLREAGFQRSFLTNGQQASISLIDRSQRANDQSAQLFVSIHHDSAQPNFLSTWSYRGKRRHYTDEIEGYSLFVSDKNGDAAGSRRFAQLLGTQMRKRCFTPTLHHAQRVPGESRELLDQRLGIYRFDDLVVLKSATMPAILLEAGLIVNRREEVLLRSPSYQKKIAMALTHAVVEFCEGKRPESTPATNCG